jgi:hypothetical protein
MCGCRWCSTLPHSFLSWYRSPTSMVPSSGCASPPLSAPILARDRIHFLFFLRLSLSSCRRRRASECGCQVGAKVARKWSRRTYALMQPAQKCDLQASGRSLAYGMPPGDNPISSAPDVPTPTTVRIYSRIWSLPPSSQIPRDRGGSRRTGDIRPTSLSPRRAQTRCASSRRRFASFSNWLDPCILRRSIRKRMSRACISRGTSMACLHVVRGSVEAEGGARHFGVLSTTR